MVIGLGEARCGAVVQKKKPLDRLRFLNKFLKAELRWPKGSPIGAPYHYRKEKDNNELIFSCWVIMGWVLLVGAYSTHDDGDSDGASLVASLFDIEHPSLILNMLWSIDTCQNKASTDHHVTTSWAQV